MLHTIHDLDKHVDGITTTRSREYAPGPNCRFIRFIFSCTLVSGTNPTLTINIRPYEGDTELFVLAVTSTLLESGFAMLELDFPPDMFYLYFVVGGTTPNWNVTYDTHITTEI